MNPETVAAALMRSLVQVSPDVMAAATPIRNNQNLLELIDSFRFVELLMDLETSLEIELELEDIDLAEIVHVENLIAVICRQA